MSILQTEAVRGPVSHLFPQFAAIGQSSRKSVLWGRGYAS